MADVNLLPREMVPDKRVQSAVDKVKSLAFFLLTVAVIALIGGGVFYYILNQRFNTAFTQTEQLKEDIKAMVRTEQQLVLFKDRLNKVTKVKTSPSAYEELDILKDVYTSLPEETALNASKLTETKAEIAISHVGSSALSQILSRLVTTNQYSKTELQQFSYDNERGYIVTIAIYK